MKVRACVRATPAHSARVCVFTGSGCSSESKNVGKVFIVCRLGNHRRLQSNDMARFHFKVPPLLQRRKWAREEGAWGGGACMPGGRPGQSQTETWTNPGNTQGKKHCDQVTPNVPREVSAGVPPASQDSGLKAACMWDRLPQRESRGGCTLAGEERLPLGDVEVEFPRDSSLGMLSQHRGRGPGAGERDEDWRASAQDSVLSFCANPAARCCLVTDVTTAPRDLQKLTFE